MKAVDLRPYEFLRGGPSPTPSSQAFAGACFGTFSDLTVYDNEEMDFGEARYFHKHDDLKMVASHMSGGMRASEYHVRGGGLIFVVSWHGGHPVWGADEKGLAWLEQEGIKPKLPKHVRYDTDVVPGATVRLVDDRLESGMVAAVCADPEFRMLVDASAIARGESIKPTFDAGSLPDDAQARIMSAFAKIGWFDASFFEDDEEE